LDTTEVVDQLLSTLHVRTFKNFGSPAEYGAKLVDNCRKALSAVLPFTDSELKFLDLLLEKGEIDPSILTEDSALQERIRSQPLLEWKAINVRKFKGIG
jgi:hypothetical protein